MTNENMKMVLASENRSSGCCSNEVFLQKHKDVAIDGEVGDTTLMSMYHGKGKNICINSR